MYLPTTIRNIKICVLEVMSSLSPVFLPLNSKNKDTHMPLKFGMHFVCIYLDNIYSFFG